MSSLSRLPVARMLASCQLHTTAMTASEKGRYREMIHKCRIRGIEILRDPGMNQGTSFSIEERQVMGLQGLLPPRVLSQDEQVYRALLNFKRCSNDLERFSHMMNLYDRNEKLFFRVITENIELTMPIIYTPTVGLACQKYGQMFARPRGIFITIHDLGHVYDIIANWPEEDVGAIVVTDGERILGLGDLGVYGMGIPVGKLALYTAIAGIPPSRCLPVCIDVGTNNTSLRDDKLYIGLRQKRERGPKYEQLLDEFMEAVTRRWGHDTLIQFEDFAQENAFFFLDKYQHSYCMFNDDIQGTASVAVAGIMGGLRITGKRRLSENIFVFQGAGQAATGIANLLLLAMQEEGVTREAAAKNIWMMDIDGLVTKERPGNTDYKPNLSPFVKDHPHMTSLEEVIRHVKPTAIVGASAVPNAFNENILRFMGEINERPIIFALSNPTSKAECTAADAYRLTEGRAVFASGSPFPIYEHEGKLLKPGQGNNAYIFPAVGLAVTLFKVPHITDQVFLKTCQYLAEEVSQEDLDHGRVYPCLDEIGPVSIKMAAKLADYLYKMKQAKFFPEPENKEEFIREHIYRTDYESFLPTTFKYPESF